ncbi:MAG: SUMF1/EgtB/PvdO family nonheme iron enzyme [Fibromonadaceae bacterium]|nr:SUMF1/EgtB/PvdO family nonheme iron enzyme [Fibromonadaceae bacterium]
MRNIGYAVLLKILLIGVIGVQTACMQLSEVEVSANGKSSSSGSEGFKWQVSPLREDNTNINYYDAILICNQMSRNNSLDTLYQYDEPAPISLGSSIFWLPNIKILENRSGYRLPTKEEWLSALANDEMKDFDEEENIKEWLYGTANTQHGTFELAPEFQRTAGWSRAPNYGMRVVKVSAF